MRTDLYRCYNVSDELLYVGVSLHVLSRMIEHRVSSEWFDQVATIKITHNSSRELALQAERHAIETEKPKFNAMHGTYRKLRTSGLLTFTDVARVLDVTVARLNKMRRDGLFTVPPVAGMKPAKWRASDVSAFLMARDAA